MSERTRADAQKFTHDNYALTTTDQSRPLPYACTALLIDNVDSAISILVSFDSGSTHKTVRAGMSLSIDCDSMKSYKIKSASGTPSVECVYASEA